MNDPLVAKIPRSANGEALSRHLVQNLDDGRWGLGAKLPSERELSETFKVSRGTVRRVIENFIAAGVLRRAPGSGTYVAMLPQSSRAEQQRRAAVTHVSPAELMAARLLIEPQLPSLIVRHATLADFERLQHCLDEAERAESFEEFEYWDGALHEALSNATHNAFIAATLKLMTEVRDNGEWGRLKHQALTPERRSVYERQHREIVARLRERNAEGARAALEEHLREVQANLFGA